MLFGNSGLFHMFFFGRNWTFCMPFGREWTLLYTFWEKVDLFWRNMSKISFRTPLAKGLLGMEKAGCLKQVAA